MIGRRPWPLAGWPQARQARRRQRWDERALWFRLRYPDSGQVQRALNLVSRHTDRLGLRLRQADGVAQLFVGLPTEAVARVLAEMAAEMGFELSAAAGTPPPLHGRFHPASELVGLENGEGPDMAGVDAYLVSERLYVLREAAPAAKGSRFPAAASPPSNGQAPGGWAMPAPGPGLTTRPLWLAPTPPALTQGGQGDWLLGQTPDGQTLRGRRVQVMGAAASVTEWLARLVAARLVAARLAQRPAGLVVLDGQGDLLPRLLSRPAVARLRSTKRLTVLDVNVAGQGGLNPLSIGLEEDLARVMARWRWWLAGMGVSDQALTLLRPALEGGVVDLPGLQAWLKAQGGDRFAAAAGFRALLAQLARNQVVYRWLSLYPVNLPLALADGALFVSCPHQGNWARRQALRAVISQVVGPGTDLVLHQVPVGEGDTDLLKPLRIVTGVGAVRTISFAETTVWTRDDRSPTDLERAMSDALPGGLPGSLPPGLSPARVVEQVQCLQPGEGLVIRDSQMVFGCYVGV